MATFLGLCQQVRKLAGLQGTGPADVDTVQGTEAALVEMVAQSYVEIQNYRNDWEWMQASKSFSTVEGTNSYSLLNIFGTSTPDFSEYKKDSFILTDSLGTKRYLTYVDRDVLEARYLNNTDQKLPTQYTIDPSTQAVILRPIPDGAYTVDFRYQKGATILVANADIPTLPLQYHNIIVYKALMKLAMYLGIPELYEISSREYERTLGQLLREKIPKRSMKWRPFV